MAVAAAARMLINIWMTYLNIFFFISHLLSFVSAIDDVIASLVVGTTTGITPLVRVKVSVSVIVTPLVRVRVKVSVKVRVKTSCCH